MLGGDDLMRYKRQLDEDLRSLSQRAFKPETSLVSIADGFDNTDA